MLPVKVISDIVDGSSLRYSRLLYTYNRIILFDLPTGEDTDLAGESRGQYLLSALSPENLEIPAIGLFDDEDTDPKASVKAVDITPVRDTARRMQATVTCEGTTGKKLWEKLGHVQQMAWNFDYQGKLCKVKYTPAGGAAVGPGGVNYNIPRVASVQRYQPLSLLRMTTFVNGHEYGDTLEATYLGSVNSEAWYDNDTGRKYLCTKVSNTTENGTLYKVVVEFLKNSLTWDQLALYLDMQGKKLPGTADIPALEAYSNSTYEEAIGMGGAANTATDHNGWGRFAVQDMVDFREDFEPFQGEVSS